MDPYNPLHFTACTVSTSTTQKLLECLNKHAGPAKLPEKKCLTLENSTKDSGYDSQSVSDDESNSEDEESCEKLNKKLWDSFSQSADPYNLLNFRACLRSSPADNKSEGNGVRTETNGTRPVKTTSAKPNLPKRHFKHYCQNKSKGNQQFLTWKKPAKVTARRTQEKQEKEIVKKVTFSPVVHVHVMLAWDFALRAARKSPWEEMARDRARFQRRIQEAEETIGCCWNSDHREKIQTRLSAEDSVALTALT
ncbi:PR15B phosphatase, partial [Polyodon spathula]|nr:PR15B phosphatase [Polyodon spathula]